MIILKVKIDSVAAYKSESQAPVLIHLHRPSARTTSFQFVQIVARKIKLRRIVSLMDRVHLTYQFIRKVAGICFDLPVSNNCGRPLCLNEIIIRR
jgi:hypothetical protein